MSTSSVAIIWILIGINFDVIWCELTYNCILNHLVYDITLCIWYIPQLCSYWLWDVSNTQFILTGMYQIHNTFWLWKLYQIHSSSWLWDVSNTQLSHSQYELCIWYIPQSVWTVYLIHPTVSMNCVFDTSHTVGWIKYTAYLDCGMYQIHSSYWLWDVSNTQFILTVGCIKYTAHTDCGMYQIQ
jgi:hypothetical protein